MLELLMKQTTLLFLLKDNQILLAMKKRGFGIGKWNGVGGKPDGDEIIKETAIRETKEEIGVTPKNIQQTAIIDFFYQENPDWDQQVLVYTTTEWEGEPTESEEMKPQWFDKNSLPFDSMWPDDPHWLPLVLDNKKLQAKFTFNQNGNIIDQSINEI
jgi:ADP-ribose pyrophosphatase YjhB (NUDIX family)